MTFVLWNAQLSAISISFSQSRLSSVFNLAISSLRNMLYFSWLKLDLVPMISSTQAWLCATTKLILNSTALISNLPGFPLWVHPYVFWVFRFIMNSSINTNFYPWINILMIALAQEIRLFLLSGYTFLTFVPPSFLKLNPRSFLSSRLTVDRSNPRKLENWFSRWNLASDNENPLIPLLYTNSARLATCLSFTFCLFIHKDRLVLLVILFSVVNS